MNGFEIDREQWARYTIFEQMGNIGSEVGRAISAHRRGLEKRRDGAIIRSLDLFSATIELLAAQHSPRLREVLLSREEFLRLFYDGTFEQEADSVERYFMNYAVAARKAVSA